MSAVSDPLPLYDARVTPGAWTIMRLDGRRFTSGTAAYRPPLEVIARSKIIAPFHPSFHEAMLAATAALMEALPTDFAHTASDEVSLVLSPQEAGFYGGRLAKWLSVAAGTASASRARNMGLFAGLPVMDARAFAARDIGEVEAYLRDRMFSAWRNCRNAFIWHAIAAQGHTDPAEIERIAGGLGEEGRRQILKTTPDPATWMRLGTFAAWIQTERAGRNPLTGAVTATARKELRFLEVERLDADLSTVLSSRRAQAG